MADDCYSYFLLEAQGVWRVRDSDNMALQDMGLARPLEALVGDLVICKRIGALY